MLFRGDRIEGVLNNFLKVTILFHLSEKVFLGEVKGCFGEVQDSIEIKNQVHPGIVLGKKTFGAVFFVTASGREDRYFFP